MLDGSNLDSAFEVMDLDLWSSAVWNGVGYAFSEEGIPLLGIVFLEESFGTNIFKKWTKEISSDDSENRIGVSLITGLIASDPTAYRVGVYNNYQHRGNTARIGEPFLTINKSKDMLKTDIKHRDHFLSEFEKVGYYLLAPMTIHPTTKTAVIHDSFAILKHDLNVQEAWMITPDTINMCLMRPEDNPIVPEGITEVPWKETQAVLKEKQIIKL